MKPENVQLSDADGRSSAEILVGFGFNCHRFQTFHEGRRLDVIWAAPQFTEGTERASGSGVPILFPFPGRLQGTTFQWEGRQYSLWEGDGQGNAIHGFVHERPWRVLEQSASRVVGQFQASVDDPGLLPCWPADFRITVAYELAGTSLRAGFTVENPDRKPLPCGLGAHPYFCVPLGGERAEECIVRLPVTEQWELKEMLVTGRRTPLDDARVLQGGVPFGQLSLDNVFAGLEFDGGRCEASIHDPASRRTTTLAFDDTFRECVVYNPPHRQALCIEPYTCAPDPFRLSERGIEAGLRVLAPGDSFRAAMEIRCD